MLDGNEVLDTQLAVNDLPSSGLACRLIYTALTDWEAGEHHFSTVTTFKTDISDGTSTYGAGEYIDDYTVYVKP